MIKIKQFLQSEKGKNVLVVIIIVLVGLSSFELGRLSKEGKTSGIKIEYPNQIETQSASAISSSERSNILQNDQISVTKNSNSTSKKFFASNRGKKYYPVGCSAGKTIKQENRIYFASKEESERAGYELSGSCR